MRKSQTADLRSFVYLDRMQPQLAACIGANSQGYQPIAGMAAAIFEIIPGIIVNQVLDAALKTANVRPGISLVERFYGLVEFHSETQSEVKHASEAVLKSLNSSAVDRLKPIVLSAQIINKVNPFHAQMLNVARNGSLLLPGLDLFTLECEPAGYIALAANEAEKSATITLVDCNQYGAVGRMSISGKRGDVERAAEAARNILERVNGREKPDEQRTDDN